MNSLKSYFRGTRKIAIPLMFLYMLAVMIIMTCLNYELTAFSMIFVCILSALLTIVIFYAFQRLPGVRLRPLSRQNSRKTLLLIFLIFLITFAFYMLYFATKYPENILGEGSDTANQYSQAIGEIPYNNWHPVLHTLLFLTLPLKFVDLISFTVFMQIVYFCLAFTYLIFVLYQNGAPGVFLLGLCLYVWLNPYLAGWMMYPVKDSALTIFAIALVAYYIRIIFSKGAWLSNPRNMILFALIAVGCTYMRHNALLFTVPIILTVLFYAVKNKKTRLLTVLSLIAVVALIQLLYAFLDVQSPNFRTEEKIGLPVSIWCNVMHKTPDSLPEETQQVMYELIPSELYEIYDVSEGFNSIKFKDENFWYNLDALSYADVIKYTYQCFRYAPKESMKSLSALIGMVVSADERIWPLNLSGGPNHLGLDENVFNRLLTFTIQIVTLFSNSPFVILFGSLGFMNLALVIVALVLLSENRFSILHSLPLLCYNPVFDSNQKTRALQSL
ncbi:MAG: hypothetical protein LUH19_03840, partial [Lachnospiraceae bacterium]|nr:hypothetical protein [Lachnospiraceae bacterium]